MQSYKASWQLHPHCKVSKGPLADHLPRYGKKWFKAKGLVCRFCNRKGHDVRFCPSKPYEPPPRDVSPFVEKLLAFQVVSTERFIGLSLTEGENLIQKMGEEFNKDNPWEGNILVYDQPRARLGL